MIFVRGFIAFISLIGLLGAIGEKQNDHLRSGMVTITCFGIVALLGTLLI